MMRALRVSGYVLVTIACGAWMAYLYLFLHFANTRPNSAQPEIGRTTALNDHGRAVYITAGENVLLNWLSWGALLSFAGGAIVLVRSLPGRTPHR
jgi:hypothetical protein